MIEILDNKMFEASLQKDKVIVTFYTNWCPICKMLKFSLEEYEELHQEIEIVRVNFANFEELAHNLGVRAVPTTLFYINGELVDKMNGKLEIDEIDEIFYH